MPGFYVMIYIKSLIHFLLAISLLCLTMDAQARSIDELTRLEKAYPKSIDKIGVKYIAWKDGSRMLVRGHSSIIDKLATQIFSVDQSLGSISKDDIKHDRYEPFFRKMYGNSPAEVKTKLVTIYWMENVFGKRYPLRITTVNGVDVKLRQISAELEKLPPSYYKYLERPAGGFYWRKVAGQSYLSSHSFGIAIDINSSYANYWLWDLRKSKRPFSELGYRNHVPMKIVEIFEKQGFLWGGRWDFYDTMHFEYRPELFVTA
jgi:peptidoglycan LD-endopeptidase CwlK